MNNDKLIIICVFCLLAVSIVQGWTIGDLQDRITQLEQAKE